MDFFTGSPTRFRPRIYHAGGKDNDDDDDDYDEFLQADAEFIEAERSKAEEVEKTISGAIGVAERTHGSLLYFQSSSKERAIEMGRHVSSLRSLEEFRQFQEMQQHQKAAGCGPRVLESPPQGGDDTASIGSIGSYRSAESHTTFLKVPKVDPAILIMQSWESMARKEEEEDTAAAAAADEVGRAVSDVNVSTSNGDLTHRSWAKLREAEAAKKKRIRRRRFGGLGGGMKLLRNASQRLSSSNKESKDIFDGDGESEPGVDSETSPEDQAEGLLNEEEAAPEEDFENGFDAEDRGLERQGSWWDGIAFNTGDEEEEEIPLPTSFPPEASATRRSVPVPAADEENEAPKDSLFAAREVSVEIALHGRLAKEKPRAWTRSFRRRGKNKVKASPAEQENLEETETDLCRINDRTNEVYLHQDDGVTLTMEPQPISRGGDNKEVVELLAVGDAFVDWTLQACEPQESHTEPAMCFPTPVYQGQVQEEEEEVEILCGDTECIDANGELKTF